MNVAHSREILFFQNLGVKMFLKSELFLDKIDQFIEYSKRVQELGLFQDLSLYHRNKVVWEDLA